MSIENVISQVLDKRDGIWIGPAGGYWSNLNKEENEVYLKNLPDLGARKTVNQYFSQYYEVIFSPKRAGGLALLDLKPGETIVDVGCMWGALTIPLAKAGCNVIAIDQTLESLLLLKQRLKDESIVNVDIVCSDLKKIKYNRSSVDKFIVNGVLEWIPEDGTIELKRYYGKRSSERNNYRVKPENLQKKFLKDIYETLKDGGNLYLAIENRFDIFHFFGLPDPHCNLRFITFMPRWIQNVISKLFLGRPYVNYTYSKSALKKMLVDIGFRHLDFFYTFPDYRYPEYILSDKGMGYYRPNLYRKGKNIIVKAVCYLIEALFFRMLKLKFFAPSFVVVAKK